MSTEKSVKGPEETPITTLVRDRILVPAVNTDWRVWAWALFAAATIILALVFWAYRRKISALEVGISNQTLNAHVLAEKAKREANAEKRGVLEAESQKKAQEAHKLQVEASVVRQEAKKVAAALAGVKEWKDLRVSDGRPQ